MAEIKRENVDQQEANPELVKKSKRLFEIVKDLIKLEGVRGSHSQREALENEKMELQNEISPFAEEPKTAEEFFGEVKTIDNKILDLEKNMGVPINFFDPKHLKILLDAFVQMKKKNFSDFEKELDTNPDIKSRHFFWALRFRQDWGAEDLKLNYPAMAETTHLFACRLIGRFFINQLKQNGVAIDEQTEEIILDATPVVSSGNPLDFKDKQVEEDVKSKLGQALEQFYQLPQAPEISEIAKDVLRKLILMDLFRRSDDSIERETKSRGIDINLLGESGKEIKKIIRDAQDDESQEHSSFFGHTLPYAKYAVREFFKDEY